MVLLFYFRPVHEEEERGIQMTQRIQSAQSSDFKLEGGAAIIAPVSAFSGSIPPNALVVVPVPEMNENLKENIERGPMAVTRDQMWELLGFNGPPREGA
jgi:hypothetical protein